MTAMRRDLIATLDAVGDRERAQQQQRYMKSEMPYHGVTSPEIKKISKALFANHPMASRGEWESTVNELWRRATRREQRYVAVSLAEHKPYKQWLDLDALPMIEEMIVTGAWWDFVDALASHHVWHIFSNDRQATRPILMSWTADEDMWRRRTSIIVQLRAKSDTDEELLFTAIEASLESKEFFLRKAIGWALREYSKTAPSVVIDYVAANEDHLSGLSRREALRVIERRDTTG